jgi:hypothetical protein
MWYLECQNYWVVNGGYIEILQGSEWLWLIKKKKNLKLKAKGLLKA